ncbi:Putative restriction endonuclease, HIRAN domain-containing protein [Mycobacterium canetti]|uniref:hypothetical protein n=1 Tax=Mycobacterium canetti TaxID=78331 RepID=UPI002D78770B|nr:hypothetical protein [Mycobacterium canetti]WRO41078.1 Putative restriction endonuclease, HIRAN domain-containing protein [Mycobacterium canetti]
MSSAEPLSPPTSRAVRRFAVAWRNRQLRVITPVGELDYRAGGYRFQYLEGVGGSVAGFRPFIGFPDLNRVYESARLWPFFDLRVMDRKRPDYPQYVRWLGLTVEASRLDILSRSGGGQKGDNVYLAESPSVADDGATEAVFLARGARYAVPQYRTEAIVNSLRAGDRLTLMDDSTNEANPRALLLETPDGAPVGWVPDLLVDYAHQVRSGGGSAELLQNNGPAAPWHARLLVRLSGRVAPGTALFTGELASSRYTCLPAASRLRSVRDPAIPVSWPVDWRQAGEPSSAARPRDVQP